MYKCIFDKQQQRSVLDLMNALFRLVAASLPTALARFLRFSHILNTRFESPRVLMLIIQAEKASERASGGEKGI
jgi:hypothetical protein